MGPLRRVDDWITATRPGWLWLGQLALVALGVHLAADRLDDLLLYGFTHLPFPGASGAWPERLALAGALAVELAVVVRAGWILASSAGGPPPELKAWWRKRSVEAFVRPLFWTTTALAGAWSVSMAVEDHAAGLVGPVALWLGLGAGALVAWRLGWTGLVRTTGGLFLPRRWTQGLLWAPLMALCAVLGAAQLPLWGWLP